MPRATPTPTVAAVESPAETIVVSASTQPPPEPSPTAALNRVVLLASPAADPQAAADLETLLSELAAADGLSFEVLQDLPATGIDASVRALAALPPDPGLASLATAHPQVRFLAVGIPGVAAAPNLAVVSADGGRPDQKGFLAGYLAAMLTPDWRVGVVSAPHTPQGTAERNGFGQGVIFYCGLCRPAYPPFVQYPFYVDLPAEAGNAELQAAVDALAANAVKTVFIAPSAAHADLPDMLAAAGLQIIGSGTPPPSGAAAWVASINADTQAAVRLAWSALLAGEEAVSVNASVGLTDINPERLSPGRQQFIERILADLLNGYIDTGIDLQTGGLR